MFNMTKVSKTVSIPSLHGVDIGVSIYWRKLHTVGLLLVKIFFKGSHYMPSFLLSVNKLKWQDLPCHLLLFWDTINILKMTITGERGKLLITGFRAQEGYISVICHRIAGFTMQNFCHTWRWLSRDGSCPYLSLYHELCQQAACKVAYKILYTYTDLIIQADHWSSK